MDINLIASSTSTSNDMLVGIVIAVKIVSMGTGTIINMVVMAVDMTTMTRHVGGVEVEVAVAVVVLLFRRKVAVTKHVVIKLRKRITMMIIIIPGKKTRGMIGVDDNQSYRASRRGAALEIIICT
jgi:hypothetical protein